MAIRPDLVNSVELKSSFVRLKRARISKDTSGPANRVGLSVYVTTGIGGGETNLLANMAAR